MNSNFLNEWDQMGLNENVYSTRTRANEIALCIFSRFIEKWLRMSGKILLLTVNDWYNPFSFAVHEQLVTN